MGGRRKVGRMRDISRWMFQRAGVRFCCWKLFRISFFVIGTILRLRLLNIFRGNIVKEINWLFDMNRVAKIYYISINNRKNFACGANFDLKYIFVNQNCVLFHI